MFDLNLNTEKQEDPASWREKISIKVELRLSTKDIIYLDSQLILCNISLFHLSYP